MADSWMLHPSQGFIRLGGHQLVQAGVAGEAVLEGDDVPGAADEAASRRHIGDVLQKISGLYLCKCNGRTCQAKLHHTAFRDCIEKPRIEKNPFPRSPP